MIGGNIQNALFVRILFILFFHLKPKKMSTKLKMSVLDFVMFMLRHTHRHMSAMTADTCIDNKQMVGGKKTAAKYGGYVNKLATITWNHAVDYQKAVENKLKKFDLNPEAFLAEEHRYAKRAICGGKLTSMAYHKDDEILPISERRWYLVTYVMNGIVKSKYQYTDANGNEVDAAVLHADLSDKRSKKQVDAGLVDIEQQVIYRNYSVGNLKNLKFEGYDIEIEH